MQFRYIQWAAGLLEGEGSFMSSKPGTARISVEMTDHDVILRLSEVTGVGNISGPYFKDGGKDSWIWSVSKSRDAAALAMLMYPLMGERRKSQIVTALSSWKSATISTDIIHGTSSGYQKENSRGYKPCDECLAARRKKNRDNRIKRGELIGV